MRFIISADTDIGISKSTNQDSLTVKNIHTELGDMVFTVICDGMGGLEDGEVASASVINAFDKWANMRLPQLCRTGITDSNIREDWIDIAETMNATIGRYGASQGIRLGTTVVAMLLTQDRYYIMNIGDSRAYEISDRVVQLTHDQTFIAREIKAGRMTPEQARVDPRRNVLLQCVGASDVIYPEMTFGDTKADCAYMLCSDGFRHEITDEEMFNVFRPEVLFDTNTMKNNIRYLIEENMNRNERDNITVALIKTLRG